VLAGVGGRTVEEARRNMTTAEFQDWALFIEKHGGLTNGWRLEQGFALLALLLTRVGHMKKSSGGQFELDDFMPKRAAEEKELTAEDLFKFLGGS